MTDEERVELLAQALFTHVFGLRYLTPRWENFAKANPGEADKFRARAKEMLHTSDSASPGVTKRPFSSLGWLN
jgi:hypothetical protein